MRALLRCLRPGLDPAQRWREIRSIDAASIVITTGYSVFDARIKPQFGYLTLPDVITSLELERMINASGPTGGKVLRISDGKKPHSILFVQCVGSRDMTVDRPYCSCVCCMQALKNAMLIKEKNPDTDVTICYMDIRSYGKGYEEYYERAKSLGVRFLRGMPSDVLADRDGMIVQIEDSETSQLLTLHPDLVVLSVGIGPSDELGRSRRCWRSPARIPASSVPSTMRLIRSATIRPGIYVAGTVTAPRDIPDSVASGGRPRCGHISMR